MSLQVITTKELQTKRLQACMSCEHIKLMPIIKVMQCRACGCPIKSKIAINASECPKGKW
jgi:hypothetical protein